MRLTDSPFSDAKAVLITFSEVSAHREDADWATVPFPPDAAGVIVTERTCDLKKLQGPVDILGGGLLTAGHYTQLRLLVAKATIYFDVAPDPAAPACTAAAPVLTSTNKSDLTIPSGEVKLNRGFDIVADGTTTIVLDFDGDKSIKETGNGRFMMSPAIGVKSVQ
ncbi:MAG TPA: DUF4382 domain-containing protein [Vicinamibacterales bacterium]